MAEINVQMAQMNIIVSFFFLTENTDYIILNLYSMSFNALGQGYFFFFFFFSEVFII
jgi:hypothetical protein